MVPFTYGIPTLEHIRNGYPDIPSGIFLRGYSLESETSIFFRKKVVDTLRISGYSAFIGETSKGGK
nr:MAG TPA: hypothetical protein [Caudoviricetes sp.]